MTRSRSALLLCSAVAVAMASSVRASAQSTCTSSSQTCYYGNNTGGTGITSMSGNSHKGVAVYGHDNNNGQGVEGQSASGQGVIGTSNVSSPDFVGSVNVGVFGQASQSTGFNTPIGVYGETGDLGAAVVGVAAASNFNPPSNGYGVYGYSTFYDAIHGKSTNASHAGVGAENTNGGYGVYATTNGSSSGFGVYGESTGTTGDGVHGVVSSTWSGVAGINNSSGAGVYGSSSSGYAVVSHGDENINNSGSLFFNGVCYHGPCTSDRRLKQNIEPLDGALDRLLRLRGVTFEWKDPNARGNQPGTQTGFVAQDAGEVFPGWVAENKDGFKTLNIPPRELAALQVEAFRTLKTENDALRAKSDKQQAQLDKQQAQLDKQQTEIDKILHGKDPISQGPGFGPGMLALLTAAFAGGTGLAMKLALKRMGLSLATAVGLLLAGRKKDDEKKS